MCLEGLTKFEKAKILTEVPPVKDEKGEITEVQLLEGGEVFDPDEFLDQLQQHQPECPRCLVTMRYESIPGSGSENFEYYRCPTKCCDTKCYVTCPANEVRAYLKRVEKQTHPCYKEIDPACFRCQCDHFLVLATSHSVDNPDRLYLKCPSRTCKFFQWINEPPRGLASKSCNETFLFLHILFRFVNSKNHFSFKGT